MNPPRPPQPSFIDARVLLVALVVASPAAVRVSQGLLSLDEMLVRYLMIAAGCAVVGTLVRWSWPLIAGDTSTPEALPGAVDAMPPPDQGAAREDLFALDPLDGIEGEPDLSSPGGLEVVQPSAGTTHSSVVP